MAKVKKLRNPADLEKLRESIQSGRDPNKQTIVLCTGTGCHAHGCMDVYGAFKKEIAKRRLGKQVDLRASGCHGFCERGSLVVLRPSGILYQKVKPEDVGEIIEKTVLGGEIIERLLYFDEATGKHVKKEKSVRFYKRQKRLIFGMNGEIDPTSIDDYLAVGGYAALVKALTTMEPEKVIDQVKRANLRGRGGGGFPAGVKWESCRNAPGNPKYVICNADEGDPGAYMDRSLLEGNPHIVIEGMLIGAYAIGSSQGYVYVRNEYPLAVSNLMVALAQARELGLLGTNILGTGFDFEIQVNRGGGAFVCGESTALMASLEGNAGEPRAKFVHTVEKGLYEKPTNLNNVETWANVPWIINKGAGWYRRIGTENSKGTKIFSLVGKIRNTGLVEVPMGITLREIVFEIGGGIPGDKKFKAVQTGGPSGGCIPEKHLDLPVDFDRLSKVGSMMGSGGMIVMDENTCMVDVARYFTDFLARESCGKCVPCREGLMQLRNILNDICEGRGQEGDLELMKSLSETIVEASLCALGTTAPNPLLTTLRYFRNEYEAHIRDKKCPAGVCKALITYRIDKKTCIACGKCRRVCPTNCIAGKKKVAHVIDTKKCIRCGACFEVCPTDAVIKI